MERDFTYIDDIIEGINRLIGVSESEFLWDARVSDEQSDSAAPSNQNNGNPKPTASPQGVKSGAPYRILNIGNGSPVNLLKFIETMEKALGKEAKKVMMPIQPGDVKQTWADTKALEEITGYRPQVDIKTGVEKFVEWFKEYYAKE